MSCACRLQKSQTVPERSEWGRLTSAHSLRSGTVQSGLVGLVTTWRPALSARAGYMRTQERTIILMTVQYTPTMAMAIDAGTTRRR